MSFLQAAGNGYLKSTYEGDKCIEVAYTDLSAGWVSSKTAGYLIWTEAPNCWPAARALHRSASTSQLYLSLIIVDYVYFTKPSVYYTCDTPAKRSGDWTTGSFVHSDSFLSAFISTSNSSFSKVFGYRLEKYAFITSCQWFWHGEKEMVVTWIWRTPSTSTLHKDAWSFTSTPPECLHSVEKG